MARRALLAVAAALVVAVPLPSLRVSAAPDTVEPDTTTALHWLPSEVQDPDRTQRRAERYLDPDAGLWVTPPAGWVKSPATALNPVSDPPESVQEFARFQVRVGDPQLYAAPIPVTSGLVADATAVISIGVAREGSDILTMDRSARSSGTREFGSVPGFTTLDEEATYEGLHVLTRYLFSREGDRVLVVRAAAAETAWTDYADELRAAIATFGGDAKGPNAPAPPPPPPPPPPAAEPAPDPTMLVRNAILERAASVLGLRYVWGGNSTVNGMDCSAYVSWTWGVSRYTTDSIWNVSFPITKGELRSGDALNLTIGRDPRRLGHIRLFEAWANPERSAMWVYEETPPRVVHRVVAYDDRYQPIRLAGLSGAGEVRLIPGTLAPAATARPATPRPAATKRPTAKPTVRATPRPSTSARPSGRVTPRPSGSVTPTPVRTPTPVPTTRPTTRPSPSPTPRPSPTGH
ncbi:MAG: hypothetical protein Q7S41_03860 [Candidatus Limnocylindria bacterium]|nr:hypothetical protein [Candidatus Limnocylindria bacterium]